MVDRYKIDKSHSQAWHAKAWACNVLKGSTEEFFMLLPEHCHNLILQNPKTVTHIDIDAGNQFKFFFFYGFGVLSKGISTIMSSGDLF